MATYKSVRYVGSSVDPGAETFQLDIPEAGDGDTVILAVIVRDEEWNDGTFSMPSGWVNAVDANDPSASLYSDLHRIHVWRYDGAPPTADIGIDGLIVDYFVAAVVTLDEGEGLSHFQFEFVRETEPAATYGLPYTSPGGGELAAIVLSEWQVEA